MYHTYVMGVDNSIYELEQQGFIIEIRLPQSHWL